MFLIEAVRLMESKGYLLGNIDVTIIAERPKISPHKQQILDNLYSLLKTPAETINLKVNSPHITVRLAADNRRRMSSILLWVLPADDTTKKAFFCVSKTKGIETLVGKFAESYCLT